MPETKIVRSVIVVMVTYHNLNCHVLERSLAAQKLGPPEKMEASKNKGGSITALGLGMNGEVVAHGASTVKYVSCIIVCPGRLWSSTQHSC